MFKRKKKESAVEQAAPLPSPYRVMVRQTGDDTWVWSVQVRMLGFMHGEGPYYKSINNPAAYGTSSTKDGAYAAAKVSYCEYEKKDRWSRETEYFIPTCEWCK